MALIDEVVATLQQVKGPDSQGWYSAICPFHADTSPSLRIKADTGGAICLGCDWKGHVTGIARHLGITVDATPQVPRIALIDDAARDRLLDGRKIPQTAIDHFGIVPDYQHQAWRYPVVDGIRWKSYNSTKPHDNCTCSECKRWSKYWHTPKTPNQFYGLSDIPIGTREIWLVNGEPSVWVCWASGIPAVSTIYGEGRLFNGAGALLAQLGIEKVNVVYDLDEPGYKGAGKAREALEPDIKVSIRSLPIELGLHGDVLDLFVHLGADMGALGAAMNALSESMQSAASMEEGISYVPGFVTEDGTIGEMVIDMHSGERAFFVRNALTGDISKAAEYSPKPETTFLPVPGKLPGLAVFFADHPEPYNNLHDLFSEIKVYIHDYVDVTQEYEDMASLYAMMSWIYDALPVVPYLRFLGDPHTGKTTFLITMGLICFRGTFTSGATSVSPVFRMADIFQGTLLFDEMDFKDTSEWSQIVKILNCGNAPGIPVLRSEPTGKQGNQWEPACYRVFGPKLISSRKRFQDDALETRCLTHLMLQQTRITKELPPVNRPPQAAIDIRNKLLKFRLENLWECIKHPDFLAYRDPILSPRLSQILAPLKWLARDDPRLSTVIEDFGRSTDSALTTRRASTLEAAVVEALIDMVTNNSVPLIKDIAEAVNAIMPEGEKEITPRRIGGIVRERLHLGTKRVSHQRSYAVVYTEEALSDLTRRYGVHYIPTNHTADPDELLDTQPIATAQSSLGSAGEGW